MKRRLPRVTPATIAANTTTTICGHLHSLCWTEEGPVHEGPLLPLTSNPLNLPAFGTPPPKKLVESNTDGTTHFDFEDSPIGVTITDQAPPSGGAFYRFKSVLTDAD